MKDPLHGKNLKDIVTALVEHFGFEELGRRIKIQCFISEPSISSSLKFLRQTPWARTKVELLYIQNMAKIEKKPLCNCNKCTIRKSSITYF
jgi:uncharacterized protein (DUF2132 family)